jgi:hypothetical protein
MSMKKFMVEAVAAGMLFGMNAFGVCAIDEPVKKSVYLPSNSWVISVLESMLTPESGYTPAVGWQEKVIVAYGCVDSGALGSTEMSAVFKKTKTVGLTVPMANDPLIGPAALSVKVELKDEPADIKVAMVDTVAPGADQYSMRFLNLGSAGHYEKEITKMAGEQDKVQEADFTFNGQVEIYSVGMDVYTWGYVLKDRDNKKLFWCCHGVGPFKEAKFYKLSEVLNAYKEYEEKSKELNGYNTRWI